MYRRRVSLGIAGAVCSAVGCLAVYLFDSGPAPATGDDSKPADVPEVRFHLMARSCVPVNARASLLSRD